MTFNMALRRLGFGGVHVAHGFRSSASSMLHEAGYNHIVIELQLSHVDSSVAGHSYTSMRAASCCKPGPKWSIE
jgi:hypothetical protein